MLQYFKVSWFETLAALTVVKCGGMKFEALYQLDNRCRLYRVRWLSVSTSWSHFWGHSLS